MSLSAKSGCYYIVSPGRLESNSSRYGLGGFSSSVLSVFFTDKFALSQSDARISVAYNSCQWKTLTKRLMKCPPDGGGSWYELEGAFIIIHRSGGFRGGVIGPPPKIWSTIDYVFSPFCIRMLTNKAQIAREKESIKPRELRGPLSRPWTPVVHSKNYLVISD